MSALGYDGYMVALEALKKAEPPTWNIAEVLRCDLHRRDRRDRIRRTGDAVRDQAFIKKTNNADGSWIS